MQPTLQDKAGETNFIELCSIKSFVCHIYFD